MKYIDLTHKVRNNMPVYPGDTSPEFRQTTTIENNGCICYQLKTGMHAGTHMDAPLHMIEGGKKLSEFPPERFFGKGYLLDARGKEINSKLLKGKRVRKGAVIFI